jgi:RNA polymerase sigma-70 factor (ECF subfamily)
LVVKRFFCGNLGRPIFVSTRDHFVPRLIRLPKLVRAEDPPPKTEAATDPQALVARALRGDVGAFEQLVASHQERVYHFTLSFVRDRELAKDLAQEALLKAYRSLPSFRFQSSLSTWLYTIVRSVCFDYLRSQRADGQDDARATGESALAATVTTSPAAGTPEERLIAAEQRDQLLRALGRLSEPFRSAVVLVDVEGCEIREAATILGVATGTVKSRLARGREGLRKILSVEARRARG